MAAARLSPITTMRAWVAERALGLPSGSLSSGGASDTKENPVGALVASMWQGNTPVYTPRSFEALAREGFENNGYVYRAITIIAQACAGIPWLLYRDSGSAGGAARRRGGKVNTVEVDEHPLLDLLNRPHGVTSDDIMGLGGLVEQFVAYHILCGNTYLYASRPDTRVAPPQELWVLRPDRMRILPAADGTIAQYRYTLNGKQRDFDPASILHWKAFSPLDDWYGLSPVGVAARIVDQMNAGNDWNTALLQNSARPSGALSVPGTLSDPQFEKLSKLIREKYSSGKNAGKPLLLEGGMTWAQIGMSPLDLEWLAGKRENVREIAVVLGVPSEMLGDSTNKTYSNFQEARKAFYTERVLPLMDTLRDMLNAWLLPMYGDARLRLDYDRDDVEALQEDRALVWTRAKESYAGGLLTLNEARNLLGFDASPEGDVFIAPPRSMTLDQLLAGAAFPSAPKPQGIVAASPAPNAEPHDAPTPQDPSGAATDKAAHTGYSITPAPVRAIAAPRSTYRARKAKASARTQRDGWAAQLTDEATAQFRREQSQLDAVVGDTTLSDDERAKQAQDIIARFTDDWHTLLLAAYAAIGTDAGNALYATWQADGTIPDAATYAGMDEASTATVTAHTRATAQGITDYTAARVAALLANATSPDDATSAIGNEYDQWTGVDDSGGSRSDVIGITEANGAWNYGEDDGAQAAVAEYGLSVQRTWLAVGDHRTRPEHAAADGQTVGLNEPFSVGGEDLLYPCDPTGSAAMTVSCRCMVDYSVGG